MSVTEMPTKQLAYTLADPGGAHPARAPPNGRGPMISYGQNANFSQFFRRSLRSRFILSLILVKNTPPPLTKSTPPPPKVKSWIRHCIHEKIYEK